MKITNKVAQTLLVRARKSLTALEFELMECDCSTKEQQIINEIEVIAQHAEQIVRRYNVAPA